LGNDLETVSGLYIYYFSIQSIGFFNFGQAGNKRDRISAVAAPSIVGSVLVSGARWIARCRVTYPHRKLLAPLQK
jgi:hypothetical protein